MIRSDYWRSDSFSTDKNSGALAFFYQVHLEQDFRIASFGPTPELLVLENVPTLFPGLDLEERNRQFAQKFGPETGMKKTNKD